jgi:hypothetical protein
MSGMKKNSILVSAFIVLMLLCYSMAIEPTLDLINETKVLNKEKRTNEQGLDQLQYLSQQNKQLKEVLETYSIHNGASVQNNLLEIVNIFGKENNLNIVSFDEPHSFTEQESLLNTYAFQVRGSYTSILKLMYVIEQQYKFGKLVSCSFEKKKNYRTYKSYLDCTIYIQRVER